VRRHEARAVTDLDVLAVRFPGAGRPVSRGRHPTFGGGLALEVDPVLDCPVERVDMIVGEVKEGRARFNPAARDPEVLAAALARFGCCGREHAEEAVRELLDRGQADMPHGHRVRLVAFGNVHGEPPLPDPTHRVVPLAHVVAFLRDWLDEHWADLHGIPMKQPALDLLALLRKCERTDA
jgi:hypothetical protein